MGLLEGYQNKYNLCDKRGAFVAKVYPLCTSVNHVISNFQDHHKIKGNMTDEQLEAYKTKYGLSRLDD